MKVTKKTRLLAAPKRVIMDFVLADSNRGSNYVRVQGKNLDGVTGYTVDEGDSQSFKGEVFVNGASKGTATFEGPGDEPTTLLWGETYEIRFAAGDRVKVVLTPDPGKPEFDQSPVEAECIAV